MKSRLELIKELASKKRSPNQVRKKMSQSSTARTEVRMRREVAKLYAGSRLHVLDARDMKRRPGRKRYSKRTVEIGILSTGRRNPACAIGKLIQEANDPSRAPGKVKTLAAMSLEEREKLEKQYGCPIIHRK